VTVTLESMPDLRRLYARALVEAARAAAPWPAGRGEPVGGLRAAPIRLSGVYPATDRLDAYREVCGFRADTSLPVTYPQVLAFPLQLLVMTSPGFPFPAVGAVHVANTIVQDEPIAPGAELTLSVVATDLRRHRRGRQVTVVTEASVGVDRPVWRSQSDFLHRERPRSAVQPVAEDGRSPDRATVLGTDPVRWELGAGLGRRYAAVSGDRNPIHLYDLTARLFGFGHHIAHGMWTVARCLAQLESDVPPRMRCEVTFARPIPLPGAVQFSASRADGRVDFSVESAASPDRHLSGSVSGA
jgi:acyl dehydratase